MKPDLNVKIIGMPLEANTSIDDGYLIEITDRLHRLRATSGENEAPKRRANQRISADLSKTVL